MSYVDLAAAILMSAISDIRCEQTRPMEHCAKGPRKITCCPLCRERAMEFLRSDWGRFLADAAGVDAGAWDDALAELSRVELENNAKSELRIEERREEGNYEPDRVAAEARAYLAEHPGAL